MRAVPDRLPPELAEALERVRPRLGRLGSPVLFFTTIGSTNDVAAALAAGGGGEGAVVIAGAQTAGRGRRGRRWFSPPASGLYVSVLLAPPRARVSPERATALLTLAAGVALAEGIETATGLPPAIKWPNDLLVGRRKVAGILAEGISVTPERIGAKGSAAGERALADAPARPDGSHVEGTPERVGAKGSASGSLELLRAADAASNGGGGGVPAAHGNDGAPRDVVSVVLGYGINVGPMAYPPELGDRATSLEMELGRMIDPALLCAETLAAMAGRYDDLLEGRFDAILDAWRARAPGARGARVTWDAPTGTLTGITAGIDDRGALLVRVGDRVERVVAGEVIWL